MPESTPPTHRRWFQFGLTTALMVLTAVGLVAASINPARERYRKHLRYQELLAEIEAVEALPIYEHRAWEFPPRLFSTEFSDRNSSIGHSEQD